MVLNFFLNNFKSPKNCNIYTLGVLGGREGRPYFNTAQ